MAGVNQPAGTQPTNGAPPGAVSRPQAGSRVIPCMRACSRSARPCSKSLRPSRAVARNWKAAAEGNDPEADEPDGGDSIPPQTEDDEGVLGEDPTEQPTMDDTVAITQRSSEQPGGTKDGKRVNKKGVTKDSTNLQQRAQDVIARAEILAPGISVFTFNSKAPAATTMDAIARLQRRALKAAFEDDASKAVVAPFVGQKKQVQFATMDGMSLNSVFMGASELAKNMNQGSARGNPAAARDGARKGPVTIADINKRNAEFWAKQGGNA